MAGRKVPFADISDLVSGRLTLQAAGDGSLLDFGLFEISLDLTVDGRILAWDSTLASNYVQFYIDDATSTSFTAANLYRVGATAIATRGRQSLNIFPQYVRPSDASHRAYWLCQNLDSSSHTIDALSAWIYLLIGDTYV